MKKTIDVEIPTEISERHCKPCTACCDGWLQISIHGVSVYPGKPCPHSTGRGCDDYVNRPREPCATFSCDWVKAGSPLPQWMKPNVAKVIVTFDKIKWRDKQAIYAAPVGREIPDRALNWLKDYAKKNDIPLVYCQQEKESLELSKKQIHIAYGTREFELDFMAWVKSDPQKW